MAVLVNNGNTLTFPYIDRRLIGIFSYRDVITTTCEVNPDQLFLLLESARDQPSIAIAKKEKVAY
ncbi:MAG: hypothetical protein AAF193_07380 [Bacteroidota bacterium]